MELNVDYILEILDDTSTAMNQWDTRSRSIVKWEMKSHCDAEAYRIEHSEVNRDAPCSLLSAVDRNAVFRDTYGMYSNNTR